MDHDLFRNRYRVPSTRLLHRDYRSSGWYFITLCTKGRVPWFGDVRNGIMGLSDVGCIVADMWQRIPSIRSNVQLDSWVVMPDHLHGIIVINNINLNTPAPNIYVKWDISISHGKHGFTIVFCGITNKSTMFDDTFVIIHYNIDNGSPAKNIIHIWHLFPSQGGGIYQ